MEFFNLSLSLRRLSGLGLPHNVPQKIIRNASIKRFEFNPGEEIPLISELISLIMYKRQPS